MPWCSEPPKEREWLDEFMDEPLAGLDVWPLDWSELLCLLDFFPLLLLL